MEAQVDWSLALSVIALFLTIPLGIASNLLTPRLISYLERRRLIKTQQSRKEALVIYNRIKAFHAQERPVSMVHHGR